MKARVHFIRDRLRESLNGDYQEALKILLEYLVSSTPAFEGFGLWPVSEFIQTYGPQDVLQSEPKHRGRDLRV